MKSDKSKVKINASKNSEDVSVHRDNINFLSKIERIQEDSLRKKVKKVENRNKKSKEDGSLKKHHTISNKVRKNIFRIFIFIAIALVILIILFFTVLDARNIVRNFEYRTNVSKLQRELNKIVKEKSKDESFNIKNLDSKVMVYDTNGFNIELVDELYEFKNEYTLSCIGIQNGELVYLGTDEKQRKIAEKKGLHTDYSLLNKMYMAPSDFIFNEDTQTIENYMRK